MACSQFERSSNVLLPCSSIASHIFPYLNRVSYAHAAIANREIFEASGKGDEAPWPQCTIKLTSTEVTSIAFSPTNKDLACGFGDGAIRIWKNKNGFCSALSGHECDVLAIAFGPDGRFLVSGSRDCTVRVWTITNGDAFEEKFICTSIFKGHKYPVHSISVSSDGKFIASNGHEKYARLWSVSESRGVGTIEHDEELESVIFAPDSRTIATSTWDGCVRIWKISSDTSSTTTALRITAAETIIGRALPSTVLRFSRDGRFLYGLRGFRIRKWDMQDNHASCLLKGHRIDRVVSVAISENTGAAAFGECDGTIRLTTLVKEGTKNVPRSFEIAKTGSTEKNILVFSPDNRILVSTTSTGKIHFWNT
jgi:WD40 repeat protein